jgi:hypothetical protein
MRMTLAARCVAGSWELDYAGCVRRTPSSVNRAKAVAQHACLEDSHITSMQHG